MPIEPLVIVLILVLGFIAFVFGIVMLFCRLLKGIGRSVANMISPRRRVNRSGQRAFDSSIHYPHAPHSDTLICPGIDCRKIETRVARYCSRCGRRLK